MKPEKDKTEKMFEALKNSPTELKLEQVEKMIMDIPNLLEAGNSPSDTKSPGKKNWPDIINLKTILMLSVPSIIALFIGLNFFNANQESISELTPNNSIENSWNLNKEEQESKQIKNLVSENLYDGGGNENGEGKGLENETADRGTFHDNEKINETANETANEKSESEQFSISEMSDLSELSDLSEMEDEKYNPNIGESPGFRNTAPNFKQVDQSKWKKIIDFDSQGATDNGTKIPDLATITVRSIKRNLYKNLIADGLVQFKGEYVEIELPGKVVLVNGETIDESLFEKYLEITAKVGHGPYRKVIMNSDYCKVGDFVNGDFKGSGYGLFMEPEDGYEYKFSDEYDSKIDSIFEIIDLEDLRYVEKEKAEYKTKSSSELLEKEDLELKEFCNFIESKSTPTSRKKKIISVNIKQANMVKIFNELKQRLKDDAFIEKEDDLVLIEIYKEELFVNGVKLQNEFLNRYQLFFSNFRIGHGPNRQIRMSEHILEIGDFYGGGFTGTVMTF